MNIEFYARSYDLDDRIRDYAETKLQKVIKFLSEPVEVRITLDSEKHRQIAEIHVAHKHGVLQAREETDDVVDALNLAVDKVEKQARRAKTKAKDRRRRADRINGQQWPVEVLERGSVGAGSEPRIIKASTLQIKPMTIEEAALQLESSKNEFLVFRHSGTDRVNVLYKRKDENYGLIAPEY